MTDKYIDVSTASKITPYTTGINYNAAGDNGPFINLENRGSWFANMHQSLGLVYIGSVTEATAGLSTPIADYTLVSIDYSGVITPVAATASIASTSQIGMVYPVDDQSSIAYTAINGLNTIRYYYVVVSSQFLSIPIGTDTFSVFGPSTWNLTTAGNRTYSTLKVGDYVYYNTNSKKYVGYPKECKLTSSDDYVNKFLLYPTVTAGYPNPFKLGYVIAKTNTEYVIFWGYHSEFGTQISNVSNHTALLDIAAESAGTPITLGNIAWNTDHPEYTKRLIIIPGSLFTGTVPTKGNLIEILGPTNTNAGMYQISQNTDNSVLAGIYVMTDSGGNYYILTRGEWNGSVTGFNGYVTGLSSGILTSNIGSDVWDISSSSNQGQAGLVRPTYTGPNSSRLISNIRYLGMITSISGTNCGNIYVRPVNGFNKALDFAYQAYRDNIVPPAVLSNLQIQDKFGGVKAYTNSGVASITNNAGVALFTTSSILIPPKLGSIVLITDSSVTITQTTGTGLSDLTYTGTITSAPTVSGIQIKITSVVGPDSFDWRICNAAGWQPWVSGVQITGAYQILVGTGLSIKFLATTGHSLNDVWSISNYNGIFRVVFSDSITKTFKIGPLNFDLQSGTNFMPFTGISSCNYFEKDSVILNSPNNLRVIPADASASIELLYQQTIGNSSVTKNQSYWFALSESSFFNDLEWDTSNPGVVGTDITSTVPPKAVIPYADRYQTNNILTSNPNDVDPVNITLGDDIWQGAGVNGSFRLGDRPWDASINTTLSAIKTPFIPGPTTVTSSLVAAGSMTPGTYYYTVTTVTAKGESLPSPETSQTTAGGNLEINLSWPQPNTSAPNGYGTHFTEPIIAFNIYRRSSTGLPGVYNFKTTVTNVPSAPVNPMTYQDVTNGDTSNNYYTPTVNTTVNPIDSYLEFTSSSPIYWWSDNRANLGLGLTTTIPWVGLMVLAHDDAVNPRATLFSYEGYTISGAGPYSYKFHNVKFHPNWFGSSYENQWSSTIAYNWNSITATGWKLNTMLAGGLKLKLKGTGAFDLFRVYPLTVPSFNPNYTGLEWNNHKKSGTFILGNKGNNYKWDSFQDSNVMPVGNMTATEGAAGNVNTGSHSYRLVYRYNFGNTTYDTVLSGPITLSVVGTSIVNLAGIPVGPKDCTSILIYRTKANTDPIVLTNYYLAGTITNGTTIYADNISDETIGEVYNPYPTPHRITDYWNGLVYSQYFRDNYNFDYIPVTRYSSPTHTTYTLSASEILDNGKSGSVSRSYPHPGNISSMIGPVIDSTKGVVGVGANAILVSVTDKTYDIDLGGTESNSPFAEFINEGKAFAVKGTRIDLIKDSGTGTSNTGMIIQYCYVGTGGTQIARVKSDVNIAGTFTGNSTWELYTVNDDIVDLPSIILMGNDEVWIDYSRKDAYRTYSMLFSVLDPEDSTSIEVALAQSNFNNGVTSLKSLVIGSEIYRFLAEGDKVEFFIKPRINSPAITSLLGQ